MSPFPVSGKTSSITLIALLLAANFLLTGCKRGGGDEHKLPSTTDAHLTDMNQINTLTDPASRGFGSSLNARSSEEKASALDSGRIVEIADIYWKLNWIRQQLVQGKIPTEFPKKLTKLRKEIDERSLKHSQDSNYSIADDALRHLEKGAKHLSVEETLRDSGATLFAAPWSSGSIGMQNYIDAGSFGFGGKSIANSPITSTPRSSDDDDSEDVRAAYTQIPTTAPLTARQQRAISLALSYSDQYHNAPEQNMKNEWNQAIVSINKLRDKIWSMNQQQNRDNNVIVDIHPEQSASSSFSDSSDSNTMYSKDGTDLPSGSAPVGDPFSTPTDTSNRRH